MSSGLPSATRRPPFIATFRSEVDDMIGRRDDVEMMFDQDDAVAARDQPAYHLQKTADVVEVQARGRLIEKEQQSPSLRAHHSARELETLSFPP